MQSVKTFLKKLLPDTWVTTFRLSFKGHKRRVQGKGEHLGGLAKHRRRIYYSIVKLCIYSLKIRHPPSLVSLPMFFPALPSALWTSPFKSSSFAKSYYIICLTNKIMKFPLSPHLLTFLLLSFLALTQSAPDQGGSSQV